jgi:hypothetical protein
VTSSDDPGSDLEPLSAPASLPGLAPLRPLKPPTLTPPSRAVAAPRPATRGRLLLVILLLVTGAAGAGGGSTLLVRELTRTATTAEATAAARQELGRLWEQLSAGQIFPQRIRYATSQGYITQAARVGIAPSSSCAQAADPTAATVLGSGHCVTMLRATYADTSGTVLATVGIAVMPGSAAALQAANALISSPGSPGAAGVRALAFPGTVSAGFTDAAREVHGVSARGPYLFFFAGGYADGRATTLEPASGETATTSLAIAVRNAVEKAFTIPAQPCADRFISC